ncbi:tyrosine-type recombinase/integrase [Tepidibacillus infernus]|uniref:tyrosine-type recombinase/integrase n=1 Tax=Tepidibacillus infernus TaxID=1806172 RepID=UPI003B6B0C14
MTTDQIDFENSTIYLEAKKVKTRVGRYVPISSTTKKLLLSLVQDNKKYFINSKEIFLSVYGTPFQKTSFRKRLNFYKEKAGITDARISPHSFRHYFAKNYILSGGDPFTLQQILGHSDIQMVRRYIHMSGLDVKLQHHKFSPVQRFRF